MKNDRISELTTYLNSLTTAHAAGYKCHGEIGEALKELRSRTMGDSNDVDYVRYKLAVNRRHTNVIMDRDTFQRLLFTNRTLFNAYAENDASYLELCFERCGGVTTSIEALVETFDDVEYIYSNSLTVSDLTDKVVFVERDIELPRGVRPKRVIRIRQFENTGGKIQAY